jgi:hypothetical protein
MLCEIVATDNPKGNAYLVGVVDELEQVAQQRGVVAAREPPPLGPLDGVQVLAREPRARQAQPRSVAERRQLRRVHGSLRGQPRRHRRLRAPLQPRHAVPVRQRQQRRAVCARRVLRPLRRRVPASRSPARDRSAPSEVKRNEKFPKKRNGNGKGRAVALRYLGWE